MRGSDSATLTAGGIIVLAIGAVLAVTNASPDRRPLAGAHHPDGVDARIVATAPATWDPAQAGDQATAVVLAQVDETLTALDAAGKVQPALAASWSVTDGGKQAAFTLRPNLVFSDGSPITAQDVVRSWLRLLDPARPSPLASLLDDITGARARLAGSGPASAVGIHADGRTITVDFTRPAAYFPALAASPSLAIVAPFADGGPGDAATGAGDAPSGVVSGAYLPTAGTDGSIRLAANGRYWAGKPPLGTIELVTDTGGTPPIQAFESGDVDVTPVGASDASWIRYDATLGPQLRAVANPAVDYYGFDTRSAPFDDPRVRLAFAQAVDWPRLVGLASRFLAPATSLVPPGIAGRDDADHVPAYDPAAARAELVAAGFPGGAGLPPITLDSGGLPFDPAIAAQLKANLGVEVTVEERTSGYFDLLASDPPQIWALSWVADFPDAQDFLGLLLESGSSSNYGRWSNSDYDAAITSANTTADAAGRAAGFATAQQILAREVPVIPVAYEPAWALTRTGLAGAGASGVGIPRFASLDWTGR